MRTLKTAGLAAGILLVMTACGPAPTPGTGEGTPVGDATATAGMGTATTGVETATAASTIEPTTGPTMSPETATPDGTMAATMVPATGTPMATVMATELPDKVGICHRTGSAKKPWNFITVSRNAVPAHQGHGDIIGVSSAAECPSTG